MKRSGNIGLNKKNSSIRSTANQRLRWLQCSKLASRKPMSSTLSLGSLVYIYYGFLATDSPVDTGHGQPWPISEWLLCWRLPPELSILHLRIRRHSSGDKDTLTAPAPSRHPQNFVPNYVLRLASWHPELDEENEHQSVMVDSRHPNTYVIATGNNLIIGWFPLIAARPDQAAGWSARSWE